MDAKIQSPTDFEWVSRLRYYWRDDVFVDMVQVRGRAQAGTGSGAGAAAY